MQKKGSILFVIVGSILSLTIVTGLVLSIVSITSTVSTNNRQASEYRERLVEDIMSELKNETQEAMSICQVMNDRYEAGEMTKEAAMKESADIIRELKYNDGAGYFWVDTSKGINVVLLGRDTEGQSRWDSVDPNGTKFIQEMIKNGMQEGGGYTNLMFAKPNETEPLPKINYTAYYEPFDWVMGTGVWVDYIDELEKEYKKEAAAELNSNVILMAVITIVLIAAGIGLAIIMGRRLTNPIKAMSKVLNKMSEGEFEKADASFEKRNDEIGEMAVSMNSVTDKLNDIVSKIRQTTESINKHSVELSDTADQISQTAEDVSNAVQEIATGATQQAEEIQTASENTNKIDDAVFNVKGATESIEKSAKNMEDASKSSASALSNLKQASEVTSLKIEDISETITATKEAVNSISEKVDGITSIATQTNLLSLNASIEAARAGEAGRGFAVVAEEIGKLAENSKQLADEIMAEMSELLKQSDSAVGAVSAVTESNNDTKIALEETLNSIDLMIENINSTIRDIGKISGGVEDVDESKNVVVDAMSSLSAISEENAASSEETGASMEELSATVTTLAASANELKSIAETLNREMEFFK